MTDASEDGKEKCIELMLELWRITGDVLLCYVRQLEAGRTKAHIHEFYVCVRPKVTELLILKEP